MTDKNEVIEYIFQKTKIVYPPKQSLATFGITNIYYYLACPITDKQNKVRVREGNVTAEIPKIISPLGFNNMFEGFDLEGEGLEDAFKEKYGENLRILEYKFKNKQMNTKIFTGNIHRIARSISQDIAHENKPLAAVIKGVDDYWKVSLMKFIVDVAIKSFYSNVTELEERGFFKDSERTKFSRAEIENLFKLASKDRAKINDLGKKLVRYGLFDEYQDRFFEILKVN